MSLMSFYIRLHQWRDIDIAEIFQIEGFLRILHNKTRTTTDITFPLSEQKSLQEPHWLVKGLHKCRSWNLCIEVGYILAMDRELESRYVVIPGQSDCWPMHEL